MREEPNRREFVKAAVATGGMAALAACTATESASDGGDGDGTGGTDADEAKFPRGGDPEDLPERQHAWDAYVVRDARNNTVLPRHHVLLLLNYTGQVPPTEAEREQVARGFETLERAYQWGTGGDRSAAVNAGLLFTVGYSPSYFDRFDASLPESLDLLDPEEMLRQVDQDPAMAERYDAVVHLASDYGEVVLRAEQALRGNAGTVNGLEMSGGFDGVFEVGERRTGFVGRGLPAKKMDVEAIPEKSPLSMGFKSAFRDSLPSEDSVTITGGPFDQGTTQQVSRLTIDVEEWYADTDHGQRIDRMFAPEMDEGDVGEVGDRLGATSGVTEVMAENTVEDAREKGVVGHSQKTARARDEEFTPIIKRRDFDTTDGEPGLHFNSMQQGIGDFVTTRNAMADLRFGDGDGDSGPKPDIDPERNGILGYIETTSRATFLMPPRSLRALPTPNPTGE